MGRIRCRTVDDEAFEEDIIIVGDAHFEAALASEVSPTIAFPILQGVVDAQDLIGVATTVVEHGRVLGLELCARESVADEQDFLDGAPTGVDDETVSPSNVDTEVGRRKIDDGDAGGRGGIGACFEVSRRRSDRAVSGRDDRDGLVVERSDDIVVSELELEMVRRRDIGELGEAQLPYGERIRGREVRDNVEYEGLTKILERDGGGDESLSTASQHCRCVAHIPEHVEARRDTDSNVVPSGDGIEGRIVGNRKLPDGGRSAADGEELNPGGREARIGDDDVSIVVDDDRPGAAGDEQLEVGGGGGGEKAGESQPGNRDELAGCEIGGDLEDEHPSAVLVGQEVDVHLARNAASEGDGADARIPAHVEAGGDADTDVAASLIAAPVPLAMVSVAAEVTGAPTGNT